MKIFLDTSSLIKLYHNEIGTDVLDKVFEDNIIDEIFLSDITFHTSNYDTFLNELNKLSKKTNFHLIDKCTVSYLQNLSEDKALKFKETIKNNQMSYNIIDTFCDCCAKKKLTWF